MKKQLIIKLLKPIFLDINITFNNDKTIEPNILDKDILDKLNAYKNKIETEVSQKKWDYSKKLCNKYDLIHICSNKLQTECNNISSYNPISRSYYKLWEILHANKKSFPKKNIKIATIAEGPGGFMEAILRFRSQYYPDYTDESFGITLKSENKDIPGWQRHELFRKVNICYGYDGTGNIYNHDNIINFTHTVGKNSCFIVTADGGFDFSSDFNRQEQNIYRLLLCEIVTAISVQEKGGMFVCKFFDIHTLPTVKLFYLLNCLYEHTMIVKPKMSRPANSEKYIVCKNFRGIPTNYLMELICVIRYWYTYDKLENIPIDIFGDLNNPSFINIIHNYNNYISMKQFKYISRTFDIIHNKYIYKDIKAIQIKYGKEWCLKHNITLNKKSKYN
jgi:hypothetical protein